MFRILRETPADSAEVEYLYDLTFAPGRTALSSYRLRDGVDPVPGLSLIARDEHDSLSAAIRYWPVRVGEAADAALLLGPVAVHPTRQGEGLGGLLVNETLFRALERGWTRVILVGDEPYYRRFGFTRAAARALDYPPPTNPDRILARALAPGAFDGVSGLVRKWTEAVAG
jgi:predicted N-acetyltransferase YhbS